MRQASAGRKQACRAACADDLTSADFGSGTGNRLRDPGAGWRLSRRSLLAASGLAAMALLPAGRWRAARADDDPWLQAAAIVAGIVVPSFPEVDFLITDYGAVPDGTVDATAAIAAAIVACNGAGGGRVVVPAGIFLTAAITLLSNVNLYLSAGATLRFSTDPSRYLPVVLTRFEGNDCYNYSPLIYANGQQNIAVTGEGVLDGQASTSHWWPWTGNKTFGWKKGQPRQQPDRIQLRTQGQGAVPVASRVYGAGHYLRPSFIQPYACNAVLIAGVTIRNAPFWVVHPLLSQNVTVQNVTIASLGPNNDGCDVESCDGVLLDGCSFTTGDDCVAIKAGRGRDGAALGVPSTNIVIQGCQMVRGVAGVAIGSEQAGGVSNVFAQDLVMGTPGPRTILNVKGDSYFSAGTVENVYLRNVQAASVKDAAITMTCFYGNLGPGGPYRPVFKNLSLAGVTCGHSQGAIVLKGFADDPIQSVQLADCAFAGVKGTKVVKSNVVGLSLANVTVNGRPVTA